MFSALYYTSFIFVFLAFIFLHVYSQNFSCFLFLSFSLALSYSISFSLYSSRFSATFHYSSISSPFIFFPSASLIPLFATSRASFCSVALYFCHLSLHFSPFFCHFLWPLFSPRFSFTSRSFEFSWEFITRIIYPDKILGT